jgi:hypothetical protein
MDSDGHTQPPPAEDPARDTTGYTPQRLIAHARQARLMVTARQIEEWHKDGLLPEPVRTKLPGQGRGRAPYQYPEPAPDAVVWLGTHRRFIDGVDATRFWMWMEGFSYVQVDLRAVVLDHLQRVWREVQKEIPSLPDLAAMADHDLTDAQREAALDEMDANVTQPMLAAERWTDETVSNASFGAAFMGILPPSFLAETLEDEAPHAAALVVDGATEHIKTLQAQMPAVFRVAQVGFIYRAVSQENVSWSSLRDAWLAITPEALQVLGPLFQQMRVFQDRSPVKTHADVLRLMKYDPLSLVVLAAATAGALAALPQSVRQAIAQGASAEHEEGPTQD